MWLLPLAWSHGTAYNTSRISLGSTPDEAWAVVDGWGLIHTTNRTDWEWVCEEAIGVTSTYDVLAREGGAVAATSEGLRWLEGGCGSVEIGGLPQGAQVGILADDGDHFWAAVSAPEEAGLYRCDLSGCVATELSHGEGDRWFVKSLMSAGGEVWLTLIHEQGLGAELWKGGAGGWEKKGVWEDGTVDPRLLWVSGSTVLLWAQPRSAAQTPTLLRSTDGGSTFKEGFSTGSYQDPIPGLAPVGKSLFLSSYLGRTWRSEDEGAQFEEVSEEAPLIRCGAEKDGETWICTDHFADSYDIGITKDGKAWKAVGCLDQVALAGCVSGTCGSLYLTFSTFGGSSAGVCGSQPDTGAEVPEKECGCGEGTAAWLLFPLVAFGRRSFKKR